MTHGEARHFRVALLSILSFFIFAFALRVSALAQPAPPPASPTPSAACVAPAIQSASTTIAGGGGGSERTVQLHAFAANVLVVPDQIADVNVRSVSVTLDSGTFAGAPGQPASTTDLFTFARETGINAVVAGAVNAGCATPIIVVRLGHELADLRLSSDNKTVIATIPEGPGQLVLTVPTGTKLSATLTYVTTTDAASDAAQFSVTIDAVDPQTQALHMIGPASFALQRGADTLVAFTAPLAAQNLEASTPAELFGAVARLASTAAQSAPWTIQHTGNDTRVTISSVSFQTSNSDHTRIGSLLIKATISNPLLFKSDPDVSLSLGESNNTIAFALPLSSLVFSGVLGFKNMKDGDVQITVSINADGKLEPRLRAQIVSLQSAKSVSSDMLDLVFDQRGVSLAPGSTATVKVDNGVAASIETFQCGYAPAFGFQKCAGTVTVSIPAFGGTVQASLTDGSTLSIEKNADVPLGNGYDLQLTCGQLVLTSASAKVSTTGDCNIAQRTVSRLHKVEAMHVALIAAKAILKGGLLGTSGVTINDLLVSANTLCGGVTTPAIVAAGPFKISHLSAVLQQACPDVAPAASSAPPPAVAITTDLSLSIEDAAGVKNAAGTAVTDAFQADMAIRQLTATIPFSGTGIVLSKPFSITVNGSLFGRRIVGVCPAVLQKTSQDHVAPLPSLAAGTASVGADDLGDNADQVFRLLGDGSYQICAGLHLTPGATTTATSDLVNLLLAFKPPATGFGTGAPILTAARLKYDESGAPGSRVSTKVGNRTLTVKELDLSYLPDSTERPESNYVPNKAKPLFCPAALFGQASILIQGIASVGTSDSTIDSQIGLGHECIFADLSGRVSFPLTTNSSILLKELHFGSGPVKTAVSAVTTTTTTATTTAVTTTTTTTGKPVRPIVSPASPSSSPSPSVPPQTVWYARANIEVNAGQGGVALNDVGVDNFDGPDKPIHISGGKTDVWRTSQMNVGWIVSGISGLFAGLLIRH